MWTHRQRPFVVDNRKEMPPVAIAALFCQFADGDADLVPVGPGRSDAGGKNNRAQRNDGTRYSAGSRSSRDLRTLGASFGRRCAARHSLKQSDRPVAPDPAMEPSQRGAILHQQKPLGAGQMAGSAAEGDPFQPLSGRRG